MNTIAFQTVLHGDTIHVPKQYAFTLDYPVLVTITDIEDTDNPLIIPRRKQGPFTEKDFTALKIDTNSFKFNREEANER